MHHGFPDSPHNTTNGILCSSCHDFTSLDPKFIPVDPDEGSTIDETRYNSLCWSCHYSGSDAPYVKTHSSLNTSDRYGDWTVECCVYHNQHKQELRHWNYKIVANTVTILGIEGTSILPCC
jgi:hypothetical protein